MVSAVLACLPLSLPSPFLSHLTPPYLPLRLKINTGKVLSMIPEVTERSVAPIKSKDSVSRPPRRKNKVGPESSGSSGMDSMKEDVAVPKPAATSQPKRTASLLPTFLISELQKIVNKAGKKKLCCHQRDVHSLLLP